ncbi:MAG: hypothetical protein R3C45_02095 [Phycisphaerales bacterium]
MPRFKLAGLLQGLFRIGVSIVAIKDVADAEQGVERAVDRLDLTLWVAYWTSRWRSGRGIGNRRSKSIQRGR